MYQGTTPTFTLTLPEDVDLTNATNIRVTFAKRGGKIITEKSGQDLGVDVNVISVFLTQEETLAFPDGTVYIQVNWLYEDGGYTKRAASDIAQTVFRKNLVNEVMA